MSKIVISKRNISVVGLSDMALIVGRLRINIKRQSGTNKPMNIQPYRLIRLTSITFRVYAQEVSTIA
jgi:hypothetical protein